MSDSIVPIITAVGGLVTGVIGFFGANYWKNRNNFSNNSTKVQLEKIKVEGAKGKRLEAEYLEMKVEYETMSKEFHAVSTKLQGIIVGLKVLFSSYMEEFKDKPHVVRSMEQFIKMVEE